MSATGFCPQCGNPDWQTALLRQVPLRLLEGSKPPVRPLSATISDGPGKVTADGIGDDADHAGGWVRNNGLEVMQSKRDQA